MISFKSYLTEMSDNQIAQLKKAYEPMRGKKIMPDKAIKMGKMLDRLPKDDLIKIYKADIPFVSTSALTTLMIKHNASAKDLKESLDVEVLEESKMVSTPHGKVEIKKNPKPTGDWDNFLMVLHGKNKKIWLGSHPTGNEQQVQAIVKNAFKSGWLKEDAMTTNSGVAGLGKDGPADWMLKKRKNLVTKRYIEVNGKLKKREK